MIWWQRLIADLILRRQCMKVRQFERHLPWIPKWTKTANEAALDVNSRKSANVPSDAWQVPEGLMVIEMRFRVDGATDNPTGTAHVYAARFSENSSLNNPIYDDICHVADIDLTGGEQAATLNSSNYIDTMLATEKWIDDLSFADSDGNNGMARLAFDNVGYDCIFVRLERSIRNWYIDISGFVNV